jgi:hypothetical protein
VSYPDWREGPPDTHRRRPPPVWPDTPWHVAPDGRTVVPETGSWSRRQERWIPDPHASDGPERPDFAIGRFDDTGEFVRRPAGQGQVIDHDWGTGQWRRPRSEEPLAWGESARSRSGDPWLSYLRDGGRHSTGEHPQIRDAREARRGREEGREQGRNEYPAEFASGGLTRSAWPPPRGRHDTGEFAAVGRDLAPPARRPERRPERGPERRPERPASRGVERYADLTRDDDWEDEEDDDSTGGFVSAVLATIAWYAIPSGAFALWTRLLSTQPRPGCVDVTGAPCLSPRGEAWHALVDNLPRLALALVLSTIVALLIRWLTIGWRALTIGFASAVVGGGIATVLFSVLAKNVGT